MQPADTAPTQSMSMMLTNERFPFQYRGKKIAISQVSLFLKFKAVYPYSAQSTSTPLADYGSSQLPVTVTPPGGAAAPPPAILVSSPGVLGGVPSGSVAFSPAAPSSAVVNGKPGSWTLTIKPSDIQNLAAGLQRVSPAGGTTFLNSDVVDDLFFVCVYTAQ